MKVLIIAEKPSVARDITEALFSVKKPDSGTVFTGKDSKGASVTISCARGHVLELAKPEAYNDIHKKDFGKWRVEDLPILPKADWEFDEVAREDSSSYLATLRRLIAEHSDGEIVNGCDAGREGELIFRKVIAYCAASPRKVKMSRMWCNEMTISGLRDAYDQRKPLSSRDGLAEAGYTRDQADWLCGMNKTVLATKTLPRGTGDWKLWSVGRVQTPTLALIYERDQKIANFVPQFFWDAYGVFGDVVAKANLDAYAESPDRAKLLGAPVVTEDRDKKTFWVKALADSFAASAIVPRPYHVSDTTKQRVEKPPLPFDLQEASGAFSEKFGWTAKRSLEILQGLYEAKLISYPRTDSRYYPDSAEMKQKVGDGLRAAHAWIRTHHPEIHMARQELMAQSAIVGSKAFKTTTSDHEALRPTPETEALARQDKDHLYAYFVIVQSCLMSMDEPATFKVVTREWTQRAGTGPYAPATFATKREKLEELGWRRWRKVEADKPGDRENNVPLPPLPASKVQDVDRVELRKGETTPPKQYTEKTLLDAMKYAGETFDESALAPELLEELIEAMKDKGIGTSATRASIIEGLIHRGYLERKGKSILITANGRTLVRELTLRDPLAVSARQTAEWELDLKKMERGTATLTRQAFLERVLQQFLSARDAYIANSTRGKDPNRPELTGGAPTEVLCPKSGKPILDRSAAWEAPGYPDVLMWKNAFGRQWTAEDFRGLLSALATAKSKTYDDLVSREGGRLYSAALGIDTIKKKIVIIENAGVKLPDSKCPKSGKPMLDRGKCFEAPGFPGVPLWKDAFGKKWNADDYVRLLKGVVEKNPVEFTDLVSKAGKTYSAKLTVDTAAKKVVGMFGPKPGGAGGGSAVLEPKELPSLICPKSKKPIVSYGSYFVAAGWPNLKMFRNAFGREFTAAEYVKILEATLKGVPEKVERLVSTKTSKTYSALMIVDANGSKFELQFTPRAA